MEEKVLEMSENYNIKKGLLIFVGICAFVSFLLLWEHVAACVEEYERDKWYLQHVFSSGLEYAFDDACLGDYFWRFIPVLAGAVIAGIVYWWMGSYELTVTDKRIYGTAAFGRRVDLPLDSISAIATTEILKGVAVSTASGAIKFLLIKNSADIYHTMSKLIVERQSKKNNAQPAPAEIKSEGADEIKKYKDLLDSGIVTQEEFDAKKKQIMGI